MQLLDIYGMTSVLWHIARVDEDIESFGDPNRQAKFGCKERYLDL